MEVGKVWMDGELKDAADATTPVLTHALHYGSGAFEGIRSYRTDRGGAIFRLGDHLDRLYRSAAVIGLSIPWERDELAEACRSTLRANGLTSAYLRPIAFYGYDTLGVPPRKCPPVTAIAAWEWGSYVAAASPRIKTSRFVRFHPGSLVPEAKICGHYVNSLLAVREAHAAGFHEALLLDHHGNVAECSGENVFAVKADRIVTPPLGNILPGITRATVIELARDLGFQVEERTLSRDELAAADEAFMTGTAAEVTPIAELDDVRLTEGAGPVTRRLAEAYRGVVRGEDPRYERYLTRL